MIFRHEKKPPESWRARRHSIKRLWTVPFALTEWCGEWAVYALSNWVLLEVLEYIGSFSVLFAVIFYFSESGDRLKQKHYQAWQVINTAQGKGGSGGRIEALQELNADGVPLVGVDVAGAFLQGIRMKKANLSRANFNAADVRESELDSANFSDADLRFANFRRSNLHAASFNGAVLDDADLWGANLPEADLTDATLVNADLRNANLQGIRWKEIKSIKNSNIRGVKNAPDGFVEWALRNGATQSESEPR